MKEHGFPKNVYVTASADNGVMSIYLDFSGQREFLMIHRSNALLYNLIKDGIYLDTLKRITFRKVSAQGYARKRECQRNNVISGIVEHLISVADEYIAERSAFESCYVELPVYRTEEFVASA